MFMNYLYSYLILTLENLFNPIHTDTRRSTFSYKTHVKDQRIFYETHKSHLVNVYKWKKALIPPVEQLYLLVLVERFNKELLVDWKLRWYNAFKETMDKEFPICTICSIPKIGAMCRDKEWKHPLYVCF